MEVLAAFCRGIMGTRRVNNEDRMLVHRNNKLKPRLY